MSKFSVAKMFMGLVLIAAAIMVWGAYTQHNGLFDVGAEGFKIAVSGAVGAFGSAFATDS